jgi:hypothetical protein
VSKLAAILSALLIAVVVRADQLWIVNYGNTPDTAKDAADKINTNFLALFNTVMGSGGVTNLLLQASNNIVVASSSGSGVTVYTVSLSSGVMTNAPWSNFLQRASTTLTNLSGTGAITNAPWSNFLQAASATLTNLSGTGAITNAPWTNSYQPASSLLTNWAAGNRALTNLSDVAVKWQGLADAHVLHYDTATGKWTNGPVAGVGMGAVNELNGKATNLAAYGLTTIAILSNNVSIGYTNGRIQIRTFTNSLVFYDTVSAAPMLRITNGGVVLDNVTLDDQNPNKLIRVGSTGGITTSAYDEGDFASRQGGSATLTNLAGTGAITNASWTNAYQAASANLTNWSLLATGVMASAQTATYLTNWTAAISNLAQGKQLGNSTLTNLSGLATNELTRYTTATFLTNWANAISNFAISQVQGATNTSWSNKYQPGNLTLTNLSDLATNELTRYTTASFLTNWANSVSNLTAGKQLGNSTLTNLSGLATNELTRYVTPAFLTNWANSISNLVQTKQQGSTKLTNWALGNLSITNLFDVVSSFSSLANGNGLVWNAAASLWTNGAVLGSTALTNLTDVASVMAPSRFDALTWDSTVNLWTNGSFLKSADTNFVINFGQVLSLAPDVFIQNSLRLIVTNLMWNNIWWTMPATNSRGYLYASPTDTNSGNLIIVPEASSSAKLTNSSNETISNTTDTVLTFDTEIWDDPNIHTSADNSSFTNMVGGKWTFTANVSWNSSGSTGFRMAYLRKNGSQIFALTSVPAASGATTSFQVVGDTSISATTDYVQVLVKHSQGTNFNVVAGDGSPSFSAKLIK